MNFASIHDIFDAFKDLKVLIIGDVMVDSYLWGGVNRISPEAPVPIVDVDKREKRLGGAANVALNVKALGATPILCAVTGNDADGDVLHQLLSSKDLTTEGLFKSDHRMTTVKHRIIAGGQHLLRIDSENTHDLNDEEQSSFLQRVDTLLPDTDVIIFEDYDKGLLSDATIGKIIDKANSLEIPTVVDPKKKNFLSYKGCTLYKPNLKELQEGLKVDIDVNDIHNVSSAVEKLTKVLLNKHTLTTLSEKGVLLSSETEHYHAPAYIRDISDVSGAGDTVISVAALSMALDLPLKLVANLSNLAGGLVCESVGVVPVDKNKLISEAEKNSIL